MLQLLTTTGCRNDAFELCQLWMNHQTYEGPVRWIVVDDGETPQSWLTFNRDWEIVSVRPKPYWKPGDNTQQRNLLAGLEHVDDNQPLVIIEDDDYYAPKWIQTVANWLKKVDLVGESRANYYNVHTRIHRKLSNSQHSSLCAMGMKGPAIQTLRECAKLNEKFIDMEIWKRFKGQRRLIDTNLVVGIKGMPGRENIGIGKKLKGVEDPDLKILKNLVGEDNARIYSRY